MDASNLLSCYKSLPISGIFDSALKDRTAAVQQQASRTGDKLTKGAYLAESVGNNTRQLYSELEKLRTFAGAVNKHLDDSVAQLVQTNTQNSCIWRRRFEQGMQPALALIAQLSSRNEQPYESSPH